MRLFPGLFLAVSMLTLGCGGASGPQGGNEGKFALEALEGNAPAPAGADPAKVEAPAPRKIIYTGQTDLIADDFEKAGQELRQLVEQFGGYLDKSEVRSAPGSPRYGRWVIRVPVEKFEDFRNAVARLGELQNSSLDSRDITDEYHKTVARLKNDEAEEAALRKFFENAVKMEDRLKIREDLRRLRSEIEVQKDQLQRWDKDTAFSTLTVLIHERKTYVPPQSPSFSTSVGRTFSASLDGLLHFGQALVLIGVALVPWLPVLAVIVVPFWIWLKRRRRHGIVAVLEAAAPDPTAQHS
jgi:hypothetical protein